jgi:hypothetical protein
MDFEIIYQCGNFVILADDDLLFIINLEDMVAKKYHFGIFGLDSEYIAHLVSEIADEYTYNDFLNSNCYAKIKEMEEE